MPPQDSTQGPLFGRTSQAPSAAGGGDDFRAVLTHLVGGDLRRAGRWPSAGVAFGPLGSAEWRVLDAQHFGVPQRRRRIFLVYRPGADCAGEVLLEPEGLRGHPAPGSRAGQADALGAARGPGGRSEAGIAPPIGFVVRGGKEGGGKGYLGAEDQAVTIQTAQGGGQYLAAPVPVGFNWQNGGNDGMAYVRDGVGPLDTSQTKAVFFAQHIRGEVVLSGGDGQVAGALSAGGGIPGQGYPALLAAYRVRRLMPVECERLQGFPDGHTATDAEGQAIADTHRYRMMGNAVAVPVAAWVARRLRPTLDMDRRSM